MPALAALALLAASSWVPEPLHRAHCAAAIPTLPTRLPLRVLAIDDNEDKSLGASNQGEDSPAGGVQRAVRAVFNVVFVVQSAFFQFLGFLLFVGLLLNISGYGYNFSRAEGLIIKPLSEFREEVEGRRFLRDAAMMMDDVPLQPDALRLRGGAAATPAARDQRSSQPSTLAAWLHSHLEECAHLAICAYCTHVALESVLADQWHTIRLPKEDVKRDQILMRRRRAAQVTQRFGVGYTPRITFLAGLMLRSLQMATGIRHIFDPTLGYSAGATLAAKFSQREWLPCLMLGWGAGGLYWSTFRVRPPGTAKGELGLKLI